MCLKQLRFRSFLGDSQISLLSDSSTVRQSQFSLNSQFSAASTATLTDPVFENECDMTTYELKAPPLPPRRTLNYLPDFLPDLQEAEALKEAEACPANQTPDTAAGATLVIMST
ncbi:hypothetical protein EB796_005424 [Bugula neritina]|uniref:Uncharacterized protein n=1 Tax=Bugula neritina TaxID=10212 RepID=A0A7J7KCB1_BUGNE|nr:hypothetical protein EB796_005424 [Bugula neritina]